MVVTVSASVARAGTAFVFGASVPIGSPGCVRIAASCEGFFIVLVVDVEAKMVVVVVVVVVVLLSRASRSELASTPWLAGNVETAINARMAEKFIVSSVIT